MIDYRSSKSEYGCGRCTTCNDCGYSQRQQSYSLGNTNSNHLGNYSGSSNSYDAEGKQ
ncbi:MAG: hypothetical protein AABX17_03930 [Nanoarchaeota archaeon]